MEIPFLNHGDTGWQWHPYCSDPPSQAGCGPILYPWNPGLLPLFSWSLHTYHLLGLSLSFGVLEIRNQTLVPRPACVLNSCFHSGGGHRWPMKMPSINSRPQGLFLSIRCIARCDPFTSCPNLLSNLHWLPALCRSQSCLLAEPRSRAPGPQVNLKSVSHSHEL